VHAAPSATLLRDTAVLDRYLGVAGNTH